MTKTLLLFIIIVKNLINLNYTFNIFFILIKGMLPTLHHGVNQSRLDYQTISDNRSNNNGIDTSESRLNKSRLLDYGNSSVVGGNGGSNNNGNNGGNNNNSNNGGQAGSNGAGIGGGAASNYSNEHLQSKGQSKYGSDYSHLPHIRQNE